MTEIKPALTPEEWSEHKVYGHHCGHKTSVHVDHKRRLFVHDTTNDHVIVACQSSIGDDFCLGVAALCLHGHPQGFTHEDVRALRYNTPELYGGLQGTKVEREWDAFLESLAARIEALLPPSRD